MSYGLNGHGSLNNALYPSGKNVKPEVGMGATLLSWTDRHPYTVISVSESGKTIRVQEDGYKRTDTNGMSECQGYEFHRDPNGQIFTLRLTKKGWSHKGQRFSLGGRDKYHDYSF